MYDKAKEPTKWKQVHLKEGDIVNGLVFIKTVGLSSRRGNTNVKVGLFRCECGKEFECREHYIKRGQRLSCGCRRKRMAEQGKAPGTTHGMRKHPLYRKHQSILTRCYNKNCSDYKNYGGRGITVSDEFQDFVTFYYYIINLPNYENVQRDKLSLDRIDNDRGYERGNLRWATKSQQNSNQRRWRTKDTD